MANDCLVTKLNGVVNNDNLKKLGVFRIPIQSQSFDFGCYSAVAGDCVITVFDGSGNVVKSINSPSYTNPATTHFASSDNVSYIEISNKYAIKKIELVGAYSVDPTYEADKFYDIQELFYTEGLTTLHWNFVRGNIRDVAFLPSIELVSAGFLSGDLKDYVSEKVAAGTTSGTLKIIIYTVPYGSVTPITVNGTTPESTIYNGGNDRDLLHWDAIDKYYYISGRKRVYIHGYTAEEIEALSAEGQPLYNAFEIKQV